MEKLLSIEELSRMLGITKSTLYSWTSQKKIPHRKLGRKIIRFKESDILDWLNNKSVCADTQHSCNRADRRREHAHPPSLKTTTSKSHIEGLIDKVKQEVLGDVN